LQAPSGSPTNAGIQQKPLQEQGPPLPPPRATWLPFSALRRRRAPSTPAQEAAARKSCAELPIEQPSDCLRGHAATGEGGDGARPGSPCHRALEPCALDATARIVGWLLRPGLHSEAPVEPSRVRLGAGPVRAFRERLDSASKPHQGLSHGRCPTARGSRALGLARDAGHLPARDPGAFGSGSGLTGAAGAPALRRAETDRPERSSYALLSVSGVLRGSH